MSANDGLKQLKVAIEGISLTNCPMPTGIYIWPDETVAITADLVADKPNFPIVVIAQSYNEREPSFVSRNLVKEFNEHTAPYSVLVYLGDGVETDPEQLAEYDAVVPYWVDAMAVVLDADCHTNTNLNLGTKFGTDERLFSYLSGHIHADSSMEYTGIRFDVQVKVRL